MCHPRLNFASSDQQTIGDDSPASADFIGVDFRLASIGFAVDLRITCRNLRNPDSIQCFPAVVALVDSAVGSSLEQVPR